ncbi:MAG: hypothetical protein Q4P71_07610 [Actinomycetaceae bacterium]|nr:hypothetical protein [Actinomycetaceae bacterium]
MFVLTVDQRGSRTQPDRVPEAIDLLSAVTTVRAFERTVGDEFQGVLSDPVAVAEALEILTRNKGWHIGLGLGTVDQPLPANAREGDGPAFRAARNAVDRAKKEKATVFLTEDPNDERACANAQALWRLMEALLQARTARQWEISHLARHATGAEVAKAQDVTPQTISTVLQAAHHREIEEARPAVIDLLSRWESTRE